MIPTAFAMDRPGNLAYITVSRHSDCRYEAGENVEGVPSTDHICKEGL